MTEGQLEKMADPYANDHKPHSDPEKERVLLVNFKLDTFGKHSQAEQDIRRMERALKLYGFHVRDVDWSEGA